MGQRLEETRLAAGMTTTGVGDLLGVKQQQYSSWEKGARIPDKHRERLAEVLGIELTDLLAWIAADERRRHDATRRELTQTVMVFHQFVDKYEEMGHTYRRLDITTEKILDVLERVSDQQAEMLQLLRSLINRNG